MMISFGIRTGRVLLPALPVYQNIRGTRTQGGSSSLGNQNRPLYIVMWPGVGDEIHYDVRPAKNREDEEEEIT
jgi:hypothetical protein